MNSISGRRQKWLRRRKRTRRQLERTDRPVLTCYRSSKHMYAQLVEAETGRTLLTVSSLSSDVRSGGGAADGDESSAKRRVARAVGLEIARRALERDIKAVAFNRNGFVYHGRVKALADGAREGGLSL